METPSERQEPASRAGGAWLPCTCSTDVYTCPAHPHAGEQLAAREWAERNPDLLGPRARPGRQYRTVPLHWVCIPALVFLAALILTYFALKG